MAATVINIDNNNAFVIQKKLNSGLLNESDIIQGLTFKLTKYIYTVEAA